MSADEETERGEAEAKARLMEVQLKLDAVLTDIGKAGFRHDEVGSILLYFACILARNFNVSKDEVRMVFELMWIRAGISLAESASDDEKRSQ
jgi:hypothetical protein